MEIIEEKVDGNILPRLHLLKEDTGEYTQYRIWGTEIDGLLVWDRKIYPDERGYYQELIKTEEIEKVIGRPLEIKQIGLSYNEPHGVLRGLRAEPMDKIVMVQSGKVFIAVADIRPKSPTFKKHVTFTLDQTDHRKAKIAIVICNGLANSFLTIGPEEVNYIYAVSKPYTTSEGKRAIKWNDPDLNIAWPIKPTIMSGVDKENESLRDLFPEEFSQK